MSSGTFVASVDNSACHLKQMLSTLFSLCYIGGHQVMDALAPELDGEGIRCLLMSSQIVKRRLQQDMKSRRSVVIGDGEASRFPMRRIAQWWQSHTSLAQNSSSLLSLALGAVAFSCRKYSQY